MILNPIKYFSSNRNAKRIFSNFISLSLLQGINYLAPLILLPYLVRVLGIETYGLWAFAYASISYFILLTDYGFEFTATKNISIHRDDPDKIKEIFNSVLAIKFILLLLSLLILTILIFSIDKFGKNYILFYLLFGSVVGQVMFPVWFFQGMEKMQYITILNVVAKLLFISMIFIFVKQPSDIYLVALFNALGFLSAGVIALYIIKKEYSISFHPPKLKNIKEELKEGWYVFTTRITVNIYTTSSVIFLGLLATDTMVGYYSIAEKIAIAVGGMFVPLLQALYPHFAKLYKESKERFFKENMKLSVAIFIAASIFVIALNIFDREILRFITGKEPSEYLINLVHILSLVVLVFPYGGQFTRMLISMEKSKLLNKIVFIGAMINLIAAPILIKLFSAVGLAYLTVFLGFYIAIVKGYFTYREAF
ncbi:MAG: flippase [Epsilonproteobacteria bacterium]|nr:flippase [Campylobacterota bacterium]